MVLLLCDIISFRKNNHTKDYRISTTTVVFIPCSRRTLVYSWYMKVSGPDHGPPRIVQYEMILQTRNDFGGLKLYYSSIWIKLTNYRNAHCDQFLWEIKRRIKWWKKVPWLFKKRSVNGCYVSSYDFVTSTNKQRLTLSKNNSTSVNNKHLSSGGERLGRQGVLLIY